MSLFYVIRGRKFLYLLLDCIIILSSYTFSYVIRFYPDIDKHLEFLTVQHLLVALLSFMLLYYFSQIYRIMWAYSNIKDVYRLMIANFLGFFTFVLLMLFFKIHLSRMMVILSFMFISVGTIFYRVLLRDYFSKFRSDKRNNGFDSTIKKADSREKRVLIIGAGEAGRTILSEYIKMGMDKEIIGFLDDDEYKIGKIFNGKMIFASTDHTNDIIFKFDINEVIIAMPSVGPDQINRIVSTIKKENHDVPIKTLPPIIEMFEDKPLVTSLRDIGIVDLIGREEFELDKKMIENSFSSKTILVTGAGGSIGSEICRQMLNFDIEKLVAVGKGENSIYNLVKSINEYADFLEKKQEIVYRIVDIKDIELLDRIFMEFKPDVVFHAAAHKHVPLMEFNEIEALQNNVIGTKNVLDLSVKYNIEQFVLVSTDKAVHPVNIMGATKRIAELVTLYYHHERNLNTAIVRFGNVIGSRGSVIPLFREQIESGGPVTVTHPEITRYFMSVIESSLLVINAAAYSQGGEIYALDMGKLHKVSDIACNLIRLYGYEPEKDIRIEYTGLRPGEKLYEELFYREEDLVKTDNPKIFMLNSGVSTYNKDTIEYFIHEQLANIMNYDSSGIRELIKSIVPEYNYDNFYHDHHNSSRFVY